MQRQHPDLTLADVARIQHLMGAESGAARRQMLEGVPVDPEAIGPVPRLVIGAGIDRQFAAAYARARAARLVRIDGSGHMVMLDQPARFAAAMRTFLAR